MVTSWPSCFPACSMAIVVIVCVVGLMPNHQFSRSVYELSSSHWLSPRRPASTGALPAKPIRETLAAEAVTASIIHGNLSWCFRHRNIWAKTQEEDCEKREVCRSARLALTSFFFSCAHLVLPFASFSSHLCACSCFSTRNFPARRTNRLRRRCPFLSFIVVSGSIFITRYIAPHARSASRTLLRAPMPQTSLLQTSLPLSNGPGPPQSLIIRKPTPTATSRGAWK